MAKKANKKVIKEAIKAQVNEGPLDPVRGAVAGAKGVGSGIAGSFRGMKANYHLNNIASQLNQFADKVEKVWNIHEPKIRKSSNKLRISKDPSAREMGEKITSEIDNYQKNVQQFANKVRGSAPGSQLSAQGQTANPQQAAQQQQPIQQPQGIPSYQDQKQQLGNFKDWLKDQGFEPDDLSASNKKDLIKQFQMAKMRKAAAASPQSSSPQVQAVSKAKDKFKQDVGSIAKRVAGAPPAKTPHPGSEEDLKSVIKRAASGFAKKPGKYKSKTGTVGNAAPAPVEPTQPIPLSRQKEPVQQTPPQAQQPVQEPPQRVPVDRTTQKLGTFGNNNVVNTGGGMKVQNPPQDYSTAPSEPAKLKRPSARAKVKSKKKKVKQQ